MSTNVGGIFIEITTETIFSLARFLRKDSTAEPCFTRENGMRSYIFLVENVDTLARIFS